MNEHQQREFILHNLQDLGNYLRGIKRTMLASGWLTRAEVLVLLQECRLTFQDPEAFDKWQRGAFFPPNPYEQRGKAFVPSPPLVLKPLLLNWRLTARHYKNGDLWFACRALHKTTELAWFVYGSVQHHCAIKNEYVQTGGSKTLTLSRRQVVRDLLQQLKPNIPEGWNNDYDRAVTAVGNAIEYMLMEDEGRKALSKTQWPEMTIAQILRTLKPLLKPGSELYPLLAPSYRHLSEAERRTELLGWLYGSVDTPAARLSWLSGQYTPEKAPTSSAKLPSPE
ncbi:hypothetical protein [Aeromonas caviae]|uniref:hypothetical protein n=2 Tax=Aeromonas caviae TaxID=648 RepID=UPI001CC7AC58|nr:hypothetical protein [Aeromonas caviae]GJA84655.1 hypothetical protein KAM356_07140 [Aeromonas caviae]GJA88689.1 hypothetical protein KAM357_06370 [Aeromonas caviae]GJB06001.1 hypothetical protein KAM361_06740 [Aeromonas caviae]GJB14509.1 hypothetical protein KAM363_05140 [Aeromonas caviae]GJB27721.1 hypothetical protein KAM366_09180 [Aeromonas caviae]